MAELGTTTVYGNLYVSNDIHANKIYGQVYNDYAEYRLQDQYIKAGFVQCYSLNGKVKKCDKDKQKNVQGIVSDTFGFVIGYQDNKVNVPISVQGRVLAFYEGDKNKFKQGEPVVQSKNGKVRKLKWYEKIILPWLRDRIIGYVDEIPSYQKWGSGNINVKDRIWIKIK